MTGRRLVPLALAWTIVVALAPAAGASHVIRWGAGVDCGAASRSASTAVDTPVRFVACVTLDGVPVGGHQLTVRVEGPQRRAELDVATGDDGVARFGVQPTAPGETTVTLCDGDGCLYGQTVLAVSAGPSTTVPATSATTATVAPADTAGTPAGGRAGDGGDGSDVPVVPVVAVGVTAAAVAALVGLRWRRANQRRPEVGVPPELDQLLTRDDLRVLAGLDAELLSEAATAAAAAPAMAVEDHLEFFLADVHHRIEVAIRHQMERIERLGPGGGVDLETVRLKHLLESRQRLRDVRQRVAQRLSQQRSIQSLRD